MGPGTITAVVPVFNQAALLVRLIETIRAQSIKVDEIIVVDNGSTDGAGERAGRLGCHVIRLASNTGFAHAVNVGWRAAATECVAILNSDVELEPKWLECLLPRMMDSHSGFATGTILQAGNRAAIDGTYDLLSRGGCAWRAGFGQALTECEPMAIGIAPGTACLFRREVLEQLSGFDERYESYLEDVDLGLRCINAGITGIYVPGALAIHRGSASLGRWNPRVVRLISRNQLLLIGRHYDRGLFLASLWHILAGQLLWGVVAARHGAAWAWAAGKIDALRQFRLEGRPGGRLREFLEASERELRERANDPYWRWYFRLTPGAAH